MKQRRTSGKSVCYSKCVKLFVVLNLNPRSVCRDQIEREPNNANSTAPILGKLRGKHASNTLTHHSRNNISLYKRIKSSLEYRICVSLVGFSLCAQNNHTLFNLLVVSLHIAMSFICVDALFRLPGESM